MKKDKSAAAKAAKLSEEELHSQIAKREKREDNLKYYGIIGTVVGIIGCVVSLALELGLLGLIFMVVVIVSIISVFLGGRTRKKAEKLVDTQLDDFFESELERAFGPRADTGKLPINLSFLDQLHPVEKHWDRCRVWRFYEGNYHGTHFSAAVVELYYLDTDERSNKNTRQTVFHGFVLRCKDVCDPALDIILRREGADHRQSDPLDPTVFRQDFSARTGNDQPADDLVTPQLRELVRKLETLDNREMIDLEVQQLRQRLKGAEALEKKHKKLGAGLVDGVYEDIRKMEARANHLPITALRLRDGEATLAINGFLYAHGMRKVDSLQNLDMIRRRFTASLLPVCRMIDILRDS